MNFKLQNEKNGFSTIVAILITSFLIILSSGILYLVLQENRNTRIVYNTISSYAASEGALEYGLLKIKNHLDGFSDKITSDDFDSKILVKDPLNILYGKDVTIEYEIDAYGKNYSGIVGSGSYEIIPLYFDSGSLIQANSKNPNIKSSDIKKTLDFNLISSGSVIWNIIGSDSSGKTFGIVGSGASFNSDSSGKMKTASINENTSALDFSLEDKKIKDFINEYEKNYLIIYNPFNKTNYTINSSVGFSLPIMSLITSAKIAEFKQNIYFSQNKSEIFELLKYSFFNK